MNYEQVVRDALDDWEAEEHINGPYYRPADPVHRQALTEHIAAALREAEVPKHDVVRIECENLRTDLHNRILERDEAWAAFRKMATERDAALRKAERAGRDWNTSEVYPLWLTRDGLDATVTALYMAGDRRPQLVDWDEDLLRGLSDALREAEVLRDSLEERDPQGGAMAAALREAEAKPKWTLLESAEQLEDGGWYFLYDARLLRGPYLFEYTLTGEPSGTLWKVGEVGGYRDAASDISSGAVYIIPCPVPTLPTKEEPCQR